MPHINYKLDLVSEVFTVHDNKVLLRLHEKYNRWLGLGGHIEPNEDPCEAAIREAKEEAGLDVTLISANPFLLEKNDRPTPFALNRHFCTPTHEHLAFVFAATSDTPIVMPIASEIDTQFLWLSEEDLKDFDDLWTDHKEIYGQSIIPYALRALQIVRAQ